MRDREGEPTGLDYQNPIQAPIPNAPQELSSRRVINNTDEHAPNRGSNAQGGLCWIPGQLEVYVKTRVRRDHLHVCDIWWDRRKDRHKDVDYERADEAQPKRLWAKVFIR